MWNGQGIANEALLQDHITCLLDFIKAVVYPSVLVFSGGGEASHGM